MLKENSSLSMIKRELRRDKIALISLIFLVVLVAFLIISSFFIDEYAVLNPPFTSRYLWRTNLPPSLTFLLGTDDRGRNGVFTLIIATRQTLTIAATATILSSVLGIIYGLLSGYLGGRVDRFMNGFVDMITVIPNLIMIVILIGFFGGFTARNFVLTLSLLAWTSVAKVVRARVIQEKNLDYVVASKTLGSQHFKIIFKKILPNINTVVTASVILNAVTIIIAEAALAFFSFRETPLVSFSDTNPTLGTLLSTTVFSHILRFRWWRWTPAATMIVLIIFSISMIGNMLNKAANAGERGD